MFGRGKKPDFPERDRTTPTVYSNQGAKPPKRPRSTLKIILLGVIAAIILVAVIIPGIKFVEAGHRGVLTHFGAVDPSPPLGEGIHYVTPYRDNIIPMEIRTLKDSAIASAGSKDLQTVNTEISVNFHIVPERANELYQQVGLDYHNRIISPAIQESVKQITARFNADELITKRDVVKAQIEDVLRAELESRPIVIESVFITNFGFSEEFERAIEAKVTAQQKALEAENKLKQIQIEAQQRIAAAEGEKQAAILSAQGQAESISIITQQLKTSPEYMDYLSTQRWDGKLPLVTGEGAFPFIDINRPAGAP